MPTNEKKITNTAAPSLNPVLKAGQTIALKGPNGKSISRINHGKYDFMCPVFDNIDPGSTFEVVVPDKNHPNQIALKIADIGKYICHINHGAIDVISPVFDKIDSGSTFEVVVPDKSHPNRIALKVMDIGKYLMHRYLKGKPIKGELITLETDLHPQLSVFEVVSLFNYSRWMGFYYDKLKDMPLKDICLPGTHDSATTNLKREWTDERNFESDFVKGYTKIINPDDLWTAMLGSARTTWYDIRMQLSVGVRAFDFRVWPKDNEFYSVHSFLGENYNIIVPQLREFLDSRKGEIVYARFRFYDEKHIVSPEQIRKFLIWLTEKNQLGPYLVKKSEADNPFHHTYGSLVDGSKHSRIIIHFYDEEWRENEKDNSKHVNLKDLDPKVRDLFFTNEDLGMDGDTNGNGETVTAMIKQQDNYLQKAKERNHLFTLWLASTSASRIKENGLNAALTSSWDREILRTISKPYNAVLQNRFKDYQQQPVSAVFVDWIEDTKLVDLAIERTIHGR